MNPEANTRLVQLLKLHPSALTKEERGFVRARRDYMNKEQKKRFSEVLKEEPAESPSVSPSEEVKASPSPSTPFN